MKKLITVLLFGILISLSATAQSSIENHADKKTNSVIEKIESKTKLSKSEKETFFEIQNAHYVRHFTLAKEYKESDLVRFKKEVKENGKLLKVNLNKAFGEKRASEILEAKYDKK